jgi:hypothetical protein
MGETAIDLIGIDSLSRAPSPTNPSSRAPKKSLIPESCDDRPRAMTCSSQLLVVPARRYTELDDLCGPRAAALR